MSGASPALSWWGACSPQNTIRSWPTSARPRLAPNGGNWQWSSRTTQRARKRRRPKPRARGREPFQNPNLPPRRGFTAVSHFHRCLVASRRSWQSRIAICRKTKERPATPRREGWNLERGGPGWKKARKMTRLTSWIPKCPRESWVMSWFVAIKKPIVAPLEDFLYWLSCFSATNPTLKKSSKGNHGFKVTSDGRLIIKDEEEDGNDKGKDKTPSSCFLKTEQAVKWKHCLPNRRRDDGHPGRSWNQECEYNRTEYKW